MVFFFLQDHQKVKGETQKRISVIQRILDGRAVVLQLTDLPTKQRIVEKQSLTHKRGAPFKVKGHQLREHATGKPSTVVSFANVTVS